MRKTKNYSKVHQLTVIPKFRFKCLGIVIKLFTNSCKHGIDTYSGQFGSYFLLFLSSFIPKEVELELDIHSISAHFSNSGSRNFDANVNRFLIFLMRHLFPIFTTDRLGGFIPTD